MTRNIQKQNDRKTQAHMPRREGEEPKGKSSWVKCEYKGKRKTHAARSHRSERYRNEKNKRPSVVVVKWEDSPRVEEEEIYNFWAEVGNKHSLSMNTV